MATVVLRAVVLVPGNTCTEHPQPQ